MEKNNRLDPIEVKEQEMQEWCSLFHRDIIDHVTSYGFSKNEIQESLNVSSHTLTPHNSSLMKLPTIQLLLKLYLKVRHMKFNFHTLWKVLSLAIHKRQRVSVRIIPEDEEPRPEEIVILERKPGKMPYKRG